MNILKQVLFILLFMSGVTIIVTGFTAYYANSNSNISEAILKDNYNSVVYSKNMLKALSSINDTQVDYSLFEKNLKLQQNNITEKGEKELTNRLSKQFNELKSNRDSGMLILSIRNHLYKVMELNMQALENRSRNENHSARIFFNYFLVSFIMFIVIIVVLLVKFGFNQDKKKNKNIWSNVSR